jgi:hypothetical protein
VALIRCISAVQTVELPGIEPDALPGILGSEQRFRSVSFQFSTARYLRVCFRVLTASRRSSRFLLRKSSTSSASTIRAAADLNERQFALLDQRVKRAGADSAQLMPGFLDRHEVPHMFLVAPRAQIKIFLGYLGTFGHQP